MLMPSNNTALPPETPPETGTVEDLLGRKSESTEPITPGPDAPLAIRLKYGSQFHADTLTRLLARLKLAKDSVQGRYDSWDQVDEQVRLYVNVNRGAKRPDQTTMTDTLEFPFERGIVVPASYAVLQVRLSQLMSILTNRSPLWEIDGKGPDDIGSAKIMEAAIEYDMQQCLGLLSLYSQMQDSEKYGIGVIYDVWESENGYKYSKPNPDLTATISQMFGVPAMPQKSWGTIREYNNWTPIDPYRFWCDPRVPKSRFQTGEFAGHRINRSFLYLMERTSENGGPYFNIDLLPSKQAEFVDITPKRDTMISTAANEIRGSNDPKDKGYYILDTLQVRLIPKEWELGAETIPEIWWFTVANENTIVRAHRSSYEHGQFTYGVIESNFDAHALYNPGNIECIDGLQRFMSWLLNSHFENIRKALNDVMVYSPALIEESDLLNPGPTRHIRMTTKAEELVLAGMLQPSQLIQQLQVGDVTRPHMEASQFIYQMIQLMMATNDPMTGQNTSQTRKTLGEVNQMMFGSSKRISLSFRLNELMGWQPMVLRAVANRQQFSSIEQFLRIAGDAAMSNPAGMQRLLVKPADLVGNFDYIARSALLPPDPGRQAMIWTQLLMGIGRFPQILAPGPDGKMLDVRKIFNEAVRTMGIRNIDQFYTQAPPPPPMGMPPGAPGQPMPVHVMPDQQVQDGVQRGDLQPLNPRLPGMPGMTP
jgi:hypothetical protein